MAKQTAEPPGRSRVRAWAPALFLLVCAPVVVDLLFGATQLTSIVAVIPETGTYGCAALLIRDCARRRGAGWPTIVTWGIAFAVIAECLIVQTSLAPQPGPHADWDRSLGVNWTYLTWALGYESGWAIALGIQLTELVFPVHRHKPWMPRRGPVILAVVFVLTAIPTWYNWTHIIAPRLLHRPPYQPPLVALVAAGAAATALIGLGPRLARPRRPAGRDTPHPRRAPAPTAAGLTAFVAAASWFALLLPIPAAVTRIPAVSATALALGIATTAMIVISRWSRTTDWDDRHRLALLTGALIASMAAGFTANQFTTIDLLAKSALNLAALGGLCLLRRKLRHRSRSTDPVPETGPMAHRLATPRTSPEQRPS